MKKLILFAALSIASPALAQTATTSIQLSDLAAQVETATALNHSFDTQALNLLREPALTYAQRTLPSGGAPYYTTSIDMVSNALRPPANWVMALSEQIAKPPAGNSANRVYRAGFNDWELPTPAELNGGSGNATVGGLYLHHEIGGSSRVNRASAILVAELRAWAAVLHENGR